MLTMQDQTWDDAEADEERLEEPRQKEGAPGGAFPLTRWTSLVQPAQQGSESALDAIVKGYYVPLQKYLMFQWRISEDRAQDLLQGFMADKILGKGILRMANRGKGKFRTFLISTLKNYSIDQFRKSAPDQLHDEINDKKQIQDGAATADESFEYEWARETLKQALEGMESECRQKGRMDLWELFRVRLVAPILDGEPEVPYEHLVARFALKSPSAAFNLLLTGKRMFERHLRHIVGTYAGDDADVEEEIVDLRKIFARAGAR